MIAFSIRSLERADAAGVQDLAKRLDKWFNAEGLAQMSRDLETHPGLVAQADGRILGFVTWSASDSETANLSWMGVVEERRRSGIGRALLAAMMPRLRAEGFLTLEVSTVADSVDYVPYAETRAFYRAMGFVDFRVDHGFYGDASDPYDRLVLRRDVTTGAEGRTGGA